jgi:hypothetical protein
LNELLQVCDAHYQEIDLSTKEERRQKIERELAELRHELEELEASLPKHSVKPSQLVRIEDLEDAIAEKEAALSAMS